MAQKKSTNDSYDVFYASMKAGQIGCFYIFHGEERYLLEHSLHELRRRLCPDGLDGFNYKRFEGRGLKINELDEAIDALPVFAERTLIEVHDYDIFKGKSSIDSDEESSEAPLTAGKTKNSDDNDKRLLTGVLSNLPEYVCLIIVYDALPYKPDGRLKLDKEILKYAQVVEFKVQEQSRLTNWIQRHFDSAGKRISKADAEYLALITDGYMAALIGEIAKVSAYSNGDSISREDIDAVVTPVLSAYAYKLTDALIARKHITAMNILDELFQLREPPQKIIFNISLKMRQFLAARMCIDNQLGKSALMDICAIRYDFQALALMEAARKTTSSLCCEAVLLCSQAAFDLNSSPEPEARLIELVAHLAFIAS